MNHLPPICFPSIKAFCSTGTLRVVLALGAIAFAGGAPAELLAQEPGSSIGASRPHRRADTAEAVQDYTDLWRAGEYEAALGELEKILQTLRRGFAPRYLHDRAELYSDLGRIDEAIADMESLIRQVPTPTYRLRLALMYRARGRTDDYERELAEAAALVQQPWSYGGYGENLVAWGRILELSGENPKAILNSLYATLIENSPHYGPGYVAAGDLAWRHYDYQLAAEYYEKALEIDENDVSALAGLAESYWKSHDPRLDATLEKIREINPNHPRLLRIEAEELLDVGKFAEALEVIERALAINPVHPDFLGLKSAALFLTDQTAGMKQVHAKALEANPHDSTVFRKAGRIASRHYRFEEAVEFQRRAVEIDPDDSEARTWLGLDLLRLAREEEGRRELETAFAEDPYNVHVYNMLQLLETLEGFERIEREPFVLRLPRDEAPILADDALGLLEEARAEFEAKYGVEFEDDIHIQLFDHHDDFMVRSVGLPGSIGYLGICFGPLVTMDSPSARPKGEVNWRSVLWHEFAHVVTLHKTNNRMPRWLSEGISVYEETQRDEAWGQKLDAQYKALLREDELPGLSDMEGWFTDAKSPAHLMFGYFASGEFVAFYIERYGFRALNDALTMIGAGVETAEALARSASVEVEAIDEGFREYLRQRLEPLGHLPKMASAAEAQSTTGVTDDGATVTLDHQVWAGSEEGPFLKAMSEAKQARLDKKWDEAEAALRRAHDLFPDYMGADSPVRQLIALYDEMDRHEDLIAALELETSIHPTDFPAWRRLAFERLEDENWPELGAAADGALGIDPFDSEMRGLLYLSQKNMGDHEGALQTLAQLILLDPAHRRNYEHRRIEVLLSATETERARREVIGMLERTPHDWKAQRILLELTEEASPVHGSGESTDVNASVAQDGSST